LGKEIYYRFIFKAVFKVNNQRAEQLNSAFFILIALFT
jgi:hypothetical protein